MNILSKSRNIRDLLLSHLFNWRRLAREIAVVFLAIVAALFLVHVFLPKNPGNYTPTHFSIEQGQGTLPIASSLKEAGLIRSRTSFLLYSFITGKAFALQSGDYLISPSMSTHDIIQKLSRGDIIQELVVIKEGWNLKHIAQEFEKRGFFTQEEFFTVTGYPAVDYREETDLPKPKDFSREFSFLRDKPNFVSLEGYLFPDTYLVSARETPEAFVRRALKNFEANLTSDILEEIDAQGKTLFEVIIFAALVEKEVRTFEDKKLVAGLLQKRMENGMRLQADAPIVYIRDGDYYRVSIAETQIESPYNTYRVYGLPLGPIANPGLESIRAVLELEESPYWYYLSARDGTTIFSETFEDHLAAKELYLR